jgi:putative ABC transport system permease protein
MRVSLVAGRQLSDLELGGRAGAAILNESGARVLFPDRTPAEVVGLSFDTAKGPRVVVGVARDIKPGRQLAAEPGVFVAIDDPVVPDPRTRTPSVRLVARATPGQWLDLRALQVALDDRFGKGAIFVATPVVQQVLPALAHLRLLAALLAALAIGALIVSATGIYAATAASLAFRRTEFAIRVALGANVRHLITLLLKAEVRAAVVGVAAGVGLSGWLGRMLEAYLTGVEIDSATTHVVVIVLLGSVALVAICGPVMRVVHGTGALIDAMRAP